MSSAPADDDTLYSGFRSPPAHARPYMRWWWHGNCLTREEICRELDLMVSVGAGGVEIDSIEKQPSAPPTDVRSIPWMSREWNEMLGFAMRELHKRGMEGDLLLGSSWPFGGPFVSFEHSAQRVQAKVIVLTGRSTYAPSITDGIKPWILKLPGYKAHWVDLRLVPAGQEGPGLDVTDKVRTGGTIDVPPGEHRLFAVWHEQSYSQVGKPSPGAEGPVLNHLSSEAAGAFLDKTSSILKEHLGDLSKIFRCLFCDSIELGKANWNDDMPREFLRRRGYELAPLLPFILAEDDGKDSAFADTVRRARYDFSKTVCELFFERFLRPFHEWCHRNGLPSRYQAYGHPWLVDMLNGYMVPDFPEGDTWLFKQHEGFPQDFAIDQIRYEVWNKYASSGAHLTGRKIIGTESMTNLEGVFMATLEHVKQADDLVFCSGVNHSILHGFNNSPPSAGIPGWVRFGTYFSEHNPWWPHLHRWLSYNARLNWVLQQTEPVVKVAILGPTTDVWSRFGLERENFINTPWYLHVLWQAVQQNGRTADYVSEKVVQEASADGGRLKMGMQSYDLLIVASARTLEPATAEAMAKLARDGKIAFIEMLPDRAGSLTDAAANDARVQAAISAASKAGGDRVALIAEPPRDALLAWTGQLLDRLGAPACVTITPPSRHVMQLHHRLAERDIYFFANSDRKAGHSFRARFCAAGKTAWKWDPHTGERFVYPAGQDNEAEIHLDPLESLLLVLEPAAAPAGAPKLPPRLIADETNAAEITGPWTADFQPVVGEAFTRDLPKLIDLGASDDPLLSTFAGVVTHRAQFTAPAGQTLLRLGRVADVSEVAVNGRPAGVRWFGLHDYDLQALLREGLNTLEVKVTTLLSNYARSRPEPVWKKWMIQRQQVPAGLIGPVKLCAARP